MAGSGTAHLRNPDDVLLRVDHLTQHFRAGRSRSVHAVCDLSIDVAAGETLGIVGESGCGKSTLGRAILHKPPPTAGTITFDGTDLASLSARELRRHRRHLQIVLQDPISSINPRRTIREVIAEPLHIWGETDGEHMVVDELLEAVGLDPEQTASKRRHELSGGQCQRVCIARALALRPRLLICDEPVSALDVSVQAQILNILERLKTDFGLTMVFIAHDLQVVRHVSDRMAVMYLGKLCEIGDPDALHANPAHPYTRALLDAAPTIDTTAVAAGPLVGELPSPIDPPTGCRFRTRCPHARPHCAIEEPVLAEVGPNRHVACHHPLTPDGRPHG